MKEIQLGTCRMINGDCMELMRQTPDKAFDLAIVDPPYGIGVNHNMGRRRGDIRSNYKPANWDHDPPPVQFFTELLRVSSVAIVWGANHFIDRLPYPSPAWIFWDKLFSDDVSFATGELAWTNADDVLRKFSCSTQDPNRIHPTQKPVSLYCWLLANYAKPGQHILDTHLGSGSHAVACVRHGFNLTATEIDPDYFAGAVERVKRELAQPMLFPTHERHVQPALLPE